ncbi:tetraspanin-18 [Octopus bimaculoides]|uniref:tetraspanin-18 n=1 Tax=Octopus bimaculoides TaxID=37653 RepID=UPI00071C8D1B|nr:tetraspanin-18 [Octopus bimaculoides]XP_014784186.1 tetraspanin-18 [Octopus bimaculoides]XP_014784187.1 tetraspanin-18 [Octopus bimaculoides]|eukprot:XP_014784185.1 PREDICTED: tetraspanin-18-like [Octopus bimaculoides]
MHDRVHYLLKRFIIFFNLLIAFSGAISIGLGLWIILDDVSSLAFTKVNELQRLEPSIVELGAYVVIAGGCAAFMFGFLAILSVCSESKCCLTFYIAVIASALTLQVSSATMGFMFKDKWQNHLENEVLQEISSSFDGKVNSNNTFTQILNSFQITFECCGVNNYTDFERANLWTKNYNGTTTIIPLSCCRDRRITTDCLTSPNGKNSYIEKGCKQTITDLVTRYHGVLIAVSLTILVLECLSLYFSLTFLGIIVSKEYELDH